MVIVIHDHVVVFGVDHEDAATRLDLVHDDGEPAEVGLVVLHLRAGRAYAGGEYLEAGVAVLDQFADLGDNVVFSAACEDGVVGVVGVGAASPAVGGFAEGVVEVVAWDLGREVEDGGGAAVDCGEGYRLGAGALGLAGTADVGVWLDAAGDDDVARGVDAFIGFEIDAAGGGDGDYLLAVDSDVEIADASGCYNLAAANDDVNHARPPWELMGQIEAEPIPERRVGMNGTSGRVECQGRDRTRHFVSMCEEEFVSFPAQRDGFKSREYDYHAVHAGPEYQSNR